MLRNNLKLIVRSAAAHAGHTVINIAGLAISIAACLLLFAVVSYELSYDKFQKVYNNIYLIVRQAKDADGINYGSGIPFPARDALRTDFPQIRLQVIYYCLTSIVDHLIIFRRYLHTHSIIAVYQYNIESKMRTHSRVRAFSVFDR